MRKRTVAQEIASLICARKNCTKSGNEEWFIKHAERIESIVREYLPHGSGVDIAPKIDFDKSNGECLVFFAEWHRMNENGYYVKWVPFSVTVKSSLAWGILVTVKGTRHNSLNQGEIEYLNETFHYALNGELP